MIAMGVDPGSRRAGWGVVQQEGSRLKMLAVGVLCPPTQAGAAERLAFLHAGLTEVLALHRPQLVGVESVFHGPNTRSLVTLGQARGALMAAVGATGAELLDLSPAEVKKAVTGRGAAQKEQVSHMVGVLLGLSALGAAAGEGRAARLDATDALAVAVAALHRHTHAQRFGL